MSLALWTLASATWSKPVARRFYPLRAIGRRSEPAAAAGVASDMASKTSRQRPRSGRGHAAKSRRTPAKTGRRWSKRVLQTSDALDLETGVFTKRSPRAIALSLKRSAESSRRRKAEPYRSAMSMLSFHINRSGKSLSPERRRVLAQAKRELRAAFGRS